LAITIFSSKSSFAAFAIQTFTSFAVIGDLRNIHKFPGTKLLEWLQPPAKMLPDFRLVITQVSAVWLTVAALARRVMKAEYLETIGLIERLHRHFLEIVKLELDGLGIHDINNVQGLILYNIGDAEMTVGELTLRGCYLGSNVSYNVKKMVENEYLVQERSEHDRRTIHVRLSEKGKKLRDELSKMHERHLVMLKDTSLKAEDLQAVDVALKRLERFWTRASDLVQRRMAFTPAA